MAGPLSPLSGPREKHCSECLQREQAGGGVAEEPGAHSRAFWWQLQFLVPLATVSGALGAWQGPLPRASALAWLWRPAEGRRAQASDKGAGLPLQGRVAGPAPASHETQ